ncbi:uncharacterized protein LOC112347630 isoform X2 [Selaginella moellendorffii]|uniref:uncharacterized protein LOC112347630 isoform X2 n=1 Tax=Selaginella moellendorffii TaxID=88036 RepID=UPI000D1C490C|nr:uncharacterized protein LOC112347630 isoform X2 [Selaginella moellendorffii]|eukprot:XP_024534558.1 uncharacterized protein LOC112347630 isoform X2 [Selaginella moellendorffii]
MVAQRSKAPVPAAPSKRLSIAKKSGNVKNKASVPTSAVKTRRNKNADPPELEPRKASSRGKKAVENKADNSDQGPTSKRGCKKAKKHPEEKSSHPGENHRKNVKSTALKRVPSRDLEIELWKTGFHRVIGVDEAGRGPLAGPVVAAACIIPEDVDIQGIDDSKKLTAEKREQLYSQITSTPGVRFSICVVDAPRIDEINILQVSTTAFLFSFFASAIGRRFQATMEAMETCVEELTGNGRDHPPYILIDGNRIPGGLSGKHARSVVKGDAESHVIAAASILAKVTRDRLMEDYDKRWPLYGFKDHKGYGTASHTAALLKHGPCDIHRRSFAPLRNQILDM